MKFTKAQEQAIKSDERNLQLIACAGSGKTEVVAQRVAHLLTGRGDANLEPRNIVAFTFTNKAAAELKERIVRRVNEAASGSVTGMAEMYVGTIHGFCQELLLNEAPEFLKYEVLDAIRQQIYVNRNSRKTGLTTSTRLNGSPLRRWLNTSDYLAALSVLREDNVDFESVTDCSVVDGLKQYRAKLEEDSYLDFSLLLENAVSALGNDDGIRNRISERVKYVVVDEYQDVNPIQERLIRLLHDLGAGLCVVGDDDQTIYQWRGSSVESIITFERRYPGVEQIRMQENFRSSEGVIETARQFVEKVGTRLPKAMKFANTQPYERGDIVALSFDSPEVEAKYIADTIRSLRGVAFNDNDGERGLAWSDMAVLLRSVKGNGAPITEAFKEAGIPYVVKGLANLFDTDEAKAARALIHHIFGKPISVWRERIDAPDEDSLREFWKAANLGLDGAALGSAVKYATGIRYSIVAGGRTPSTIQRIFLHFLELAGVREERAPEGRGQVAMFNLGRFSQAITDWETIHFNSSMSASVEGFVRFLYYQAEGAYSEGSADNDYMEPDAVQIMTVHQAKGREWPVVFLPALLRNRFPSPNRSSPIWQLIPYEAVDGAGRYDGSKDDERRLFYVAMTRSKKFLHMTWAPVPDNQLYKRKSEFWDDILMSKWVRRRRQDYSARPRLVPEPRASVSNVEFSFTDLKYLFECGYQFKLRTLYGFVSPLVAPMGYGKSLHDALAEVHQKAMRGEFMTETDAPQLVERHLRTPYASRDLRETLARAAERDIANYIRDNSDKLPLIEYSEQPVEISLGDGVSVNGRIDLVRRTDTDEIFIVDMKSNERTQEEEVTELQLHTYALGYRELTGSDADYVEIYELDERRPKPRPVDDDFIDDVREKTRAAAKSLRSMQLDPEPTRPKCERCDFSSICGASMA